MTVDVLTGAKSIPGCLLQDAHVDCAHCKIRFLSVCQGLADHDQAALAAIVQPRCYPMRQLLFQEGTPADYVFTLTEGTVRMARLLPDGRRQIVGFALPGDFLGLALSAHYPFTAEAIDDVRACRIPRRGFQKLIDERPALLHRLHEMTAAGLTQANEQMVVLGRRNAEEKVACFLISMRDRWARIDGRSVTVPLTMTRSDIGDYLGLTIETVSRTISRLARERVILVVPDGVRLLDVAKIEALAAG